MATPLSVVVLNSSVIMAGIASSLGECDDLCVRAVRQIQDIRTCEEPYEHEVLLVDIAAVAPEVILTFALLHPEFSVLGIDVHGERAVAFAGTNYPLWTTHELIQLIQHTQKCTIFEPELTKHS